MSNPLLVLALVAAVTKWDFEIHAHMPNLSQLIGNVMPVTINAQSVGLQIYNKVYFPSSHMFRVKQCLNVLFMLPRLHPKFSFQNVDLLIMQDTNCLF
jgi:hypothetical protein